MEAVTAEAVADDLDTIEETVEEWGDDNTDNEAGSTEPNLITPERIAAEVVELEGYRNLARSIQINAKGDRLANECQVSSNAIGGEGWAAQGGDLHRISTYPNLRRGPPR